MISLLVKNGAAIQGCRTQLIKGLVLNVKRIAIPEFREPKYRAVSATMS